MAIIYFHQTKQSFFPFYNSVFKCIRIICLAFVLFCLFFGSFFQQNSLYLQSPCLSSVWPHLPSWELYIFYPLRSLKIDVYEPLFFSSWNRITIIPEFMINYSWALNTAHFALHEPLGGFHWIELDIPFLKSYATQWRSTNHQGGACAEASWDDGKQFSIIGFSNHGRKSKL